MLGVYFSGTGNSKYVLEVFLKEFNSDFTMVSIEDENCISELLKNDELVFSYPVYYSSVPEILKDFIKNHSDIWRGKRIFVIAWGYLVETVQEF